jgi:hypothetical protein
MKKFTARDLNKVGFDRREDLDFNDDGNHFRCWSKGNVRISFLSKVYDGVTNYFIGLQALGDLFYSYKEFLDEFNGNCNEYNGCTEVDVEGLCKLVDEYDRASSVANKKRIAELYAMTTEDIDQMIDMVKTEKATIKASIEDAKKHFNIDAASNYDFMQFKRIIETANHKMLMCDKSADDLVAYKGAIATGSFNVMVNGMGLNRMVTNLKYCNNVAVDTDWFSRYVGCLDYITE